MLVLAAGGESQEAKEVLATALVLGAFVVAALWRKEPRRRAMEAEARRLGLSFSPKDRLDLIEPFAMFGAWSKLYAEVGNVLWGHWSGHEVEVFDDSYAQSEDDRRTLSCALIGVPHGWPSLEIRPETPVSRLTKVAFPDVEFESEAFNRAFSDAPHHGSPRRSSMPA